MENQENQQVEKPNVQSGQYVGVEKFNRVSEQMEKMKAEQAKLMEQLAEQKANAEKLATELAEKQNKFETQQKDNEITKLIMANRAKDAKVIKALLNTQDINMVDGKLEGLDAQLEELKQTHAYLFEANIQGFVLTLLIERLNLGFKIHTQCFNVLWKDRILQIV